MIPLQGAEWRTKAWRSEPRSVEIEEVKDDEVTFFFLDGDQRSRCSLVPFLRTYEWAP